MFSFIKDLFEEKELTKEVLQYKTVMLSNKLMVVQGFLTLLKVEENEIILKVKDGELTISGQDLKIKEINNKVISIKGLLQKVEVGK